jgi:hypothetical protein
MYFETAADGVALSWLRLDGLPTLAACVSRLA